MVDRSVEVRLLLDINQYKREAAAASGVTEGLASKLRRTDTDVVSLTGSFDDAGDGTKSFSAELRENGNELGRVQGSLKSTGTEASALGVKMRGAGDETENLTTRLRSGENALNSYSGRAGLLAQIVATIGPSLVPVGAVGVPGVTGLAAAAVGGALAFGSLLGSIQGVGDALKALDNYQVDPSEKNLEKLQEELSKISPVARGFVAALDDFEPTLKMLRDAGAEGWFPGLVEAMEEAKDLAPEVASLTRGIGEAGGAAVAGGVDSLNGPRWAEFWDFLDREAPSILTRVSGILGDLGHGAAEMWMSFDPGNDDFLAWLGDVADGFDAWASSSAGRDDIEGFLAYAKENGPAVEDFFVSLVDATSQIVQAAAPLGGPTLKILTSVSDVIGAIAESDLGTPILAGVAALSVYNRTLSITAGLQKSTFGRTAMGNAPSASTAGRDLSFGGLVGRQVNDVKTALPTLRQLGTTLAFAGQSSKYASEQTLKARESVRGFARAAAPGALGAAAMAASFSGVADQAGLSNTASLAMLGTLGGPWGAGLGAAAGFALDAAAANNEFEDSVRQAGDALGSVDFARQNEAFTEARSQLADLKKDLDPNDWSNVFDPGFYKSSIEKGLGGIGIGNGSDVTDAERDFAKLEARMNNSQSAAAGLGRALDLTIGPLDGSARSARELTAAYEAAAPAMEKLGLEQKDLEALRARQSAAGSVFDDLLQGVSGGGASFDPTGFSDATKAIADMTAYMDSAAGRTAALGDVFAHLGDDAVSASDGAASLSAALDALLSPANDAEAATDAWRTSLQTLRKELNDKAGFEGMSKEAVANRELTRSYVDGVEQRLVALAKNGAGEVEMAKAVRESRQEFISSGVAAGFSAKEMAARAKEIGLTPKLVRTVFEANGITETDLKVRTLKELYGGLPKKVQTEIRTNGIPETRKEAKDLANTLDLTARERKALLRLVDLASDDAAAAGRFMDAVTKKTRQAVIKAKDEASGIIRGIINTLNGVHDKTVTVRTNYVNTHGGRTDIPTPGSAADGSTVPKTGLPYADRHLYLLADGEEVVSNRHGQADRHRPLLKAINADRLAEGGTTGPGRFDFLRTTSAASPFDLNAMAQVANQLHGLTDLMRGVNTAGKKELDRRDRALERLTKQFDRENQHRVDQDQKEVDAGRERLRALKDEREAIEDSVTQWLTSDIFAAQDRPEFQVDWSNVDPATMTPEAQREFVQAQVDAYMKANPILTPEDILRSDIKQAQELERLTEQLKDKGLDGDALMALINSNDLDQIRAYATGSRADLREYRRLFDRRAKYNDRAGSAVAAAEGVTREIRAQTRVLDRSLDELRESKNVMREGTAELRRANNKIDRQIRLAEEAPKKTGDEVAKGLNKAVTKELRR